MSAKPAPTRKLLIQQILAGLDGLTPRDDVEKRILQQWPSSAKNPRQSIRDALRWDHLGRDYVLLDAVTILPIRLALQGVRVRIRLERGEVQQGVLIVYPAFEYFLSRKPDEAPFVDARDQPLSTRVVRYTQEVEDLLGGRQKVQVAAFDLAKWFRTQRVRAKDDVLVTVLDWETAHFRLEHEPTQQRHEDVIAQQNRALADIFYALLEETYDERLSTWVAVPTVYARLPTARDYPGDHCRIVLEQDPRMRVEPSQILPADQLLPFEQMFEDEETVAVREQPFTREQGQQMYRFKASAYGKRERIIEIQGKHTLADWDNILREAFDLDRLDHLSESTRIIPWGKRKKPHEMRYGELNPFERTPAAKVRVAGLGLEVGAQFVYVYDFGDWIEHRLTLEDIHAPDRADKYPRIVAATKHSPRHEG
jgi:hypothetical protein